ncbi:MAG: mechanosensitive ion channel domain-containing protein [Pseudomonadota bacterium]
MSAFGHSLWGLLNVDQLAQWVVQLVPRLLSAALILLLFWVLWRVARGAIQALGRRATIDATATRFVETVVRVTLLTIGGVTALGKLGINTASILTSMGVAGLTIGFAAKDALSNMISGLFIFWDRPFVIGDLVEIDGKYGRVDNITMRSTRVVTPDGKMLAVPNSVVVNSTVVSYTNFPHLRLDIPVTVNVNTHLAAARRALLALCAAQDWLMKDPAPAVLVTALNDYNVELTLQAWIEDEAQHIVLRARLREAVFGALNAAGVDMPFETLRIEAVAPAAPAVGAVQAAPS